MATAAQYACFKEIFDRENSRQESLVERGTIYLSIITLYLGLLAVAADKVIPNINQSGLAMAAYLASFVAFVASMTFVVLAMGIYKYVYPTDPKTVVEGIDQRWPSDAEFFDARIAELAAAFKTNQPVNERRANYLKFASFCMLAGIGLQAVVLSLLLFIPK